MWACCFFCIHDISCFVMTAWGFCTIIPCEFPFNKLFYMYIFLYHLSLFRPGFHICFGFDFMSQLVLNQSRYLNHENTKSDTCHHKYNPTTIIRQSEWWPQSDCVCVFLYMLLRQGHKKYFTNKMRTFLLVLKTKWVFEGWDLVLRDRLRMRFGIRHLFLMGMVWVRS